MKKKRIVIGAVLLILIICAFILLIKPQGINNSPAESEQTRTQNDDENVKTLIHKDFKATIQEGWQEIEIPSSTFIFLPPNTSQDDVKAEVISITVSTLGNNPLSLNELITLGIENSKKIMPDFELIEDASIEGKLNGRKLNFIGTQEGIKRDFIQVAGIKYNKLYALTYSCPINECSYNEIFNHFIESMEPIE